MCCKKDNPVICIARAGLLWTLKVAVSHLSADEVLALCMRIHPAKDKGLKRHENVLRDRLILQWSLWQAVRCALRSTTVGTGVQWWKVCFHYILCNFFCFRKCLKIEVLFHCFTFEVVCQNGHTFCSSCSRQLTIRAQCRQTYVLFEQYTYWENIKTEIFV